MSKEIKEKKAEEQKVRKLNKEKRTAQELAVEKSQLLQKGILDGVGDVLDKAEKDGKTYTFHEVLDALLIVTHTYNKRALLEAQKAIEASIKQTK